MSFGHDVGLEERSEAAAGASEGWFSGLLKPVAPASPRGKSSMSG